MPRRRRWRSCFILAAPSHTLGQSAAFPRLAVESSKKLCANPGSLGCVAALPAAAGSVATSLGMTKWGKSARLKPCSSLCSCVVNVRNAAGCVSRVIGSLPLLDVELFLVLCRIALYDDGLLQDLFHLVKPARIVLFQRLGHFRIHAQHHLLLVEMA